MAENKDSLRKASVEEEVDRVDEIIIKDSTADEIDLSNEDEVLDDDSEASEVPDIRNYFADDDENESAAKEFDLLTSGITGNVQEASESRISPEEEYFSLNPSINDTDVSQNEFPNEGDASNDVPSTLISSYFMNNELLTMETELREDVQFFEKISTSPTATATVPPSELSLSSLPKRTISIEISEADQICSTWIPSPSTAKLLKERIFNPDFVVPESLLTKPILLIRESLGNPVAALSSHYGLGTTPGKIPKAEVLHDESGLSQLMAEKNYRSAIDLTGELIAKFEIENGAFHTPEYFQLWSCRFGLLIHVQEYTFCESEFANFGTLDQPDLYYQWYPDTYPGKQGCMIPFSTRMHHALLPYYLNMPHQAINRLQNLKEIIRKILANLKNSDRQTDDEEAEPFSQKYQHKAMSLWTRRLLDVEYGVCNVLIATNQHLAVIKILSHFLENYQKYIDKATLLNDIGRVYLQLGNIQLATQYFEKSQQELETKGAETEETVGTLFNRAFIEIANGKMAEAYDYFQELCTKFPNNAVGTNNFAVCALYCGRLSEAIDILEKGISKFPTECLQEPLICNLSTLYELQSNNATKKKLELLTQVEKFCGDGFLSINLKLNG